nr:ribonuclease H-like domain-containing protein [Tanacetum cinerariifolium]
EVLEAKTVEVMKVGTEHNAVDALTKVVPGHKLQHCLELLSVGASSHLNNSVTNLSEVFNLCMYPSVSVGDGHSIPVTNTGHSILLTFVRHLYLNNVLITPHIVKNLIFVRQFVRDNNCTIEFDAFGFSVKDFMTRRVLIRCDSTGDLYPVTHPFPIPRAFLASQHMWHQRLGHPGGDVLCRLVSNNVISCNNDKPPVLYHACQLGKHVRLSVVSSNTVVTSCFEIIHSNCDHGGEFNNRNIHKLFVENGYASNHHGYRCLDLKTNTIIIPRHVAFDETVFPYGSTQPALPPTYTFLDDIPDIIPPVIPTNPAMQLSPEPITPIYNTENQAHSPQQLSPDQVQTTKNQAHSPPPSTSTKAHMVNCNPSRTPVDTESKLGIDGDPVCLHMHDPREPHLSALKRVLRRLSWSSKRQPTLSRSSAEAEYCGVANAVAETCWLRNLLREFHTPLSSATLVYYDNVRAVYLSCNPVQHQRTKHIEIDIHFVRDLVAAGQVRVLHVPYRYQFANIFIKGLSSALFEEFCFSLSVRVPPVQTAGEC